MMKFVLKADTSSPGPSTTTSTEAASLCPSSMISSATRVSMSDPSAQPVDPALWPAQLSEVERVEFVRRGPFKVVSDFTFPTTDGRGFHSDLFYRSLANGERVPRSWLVYSKHKNSVFCFACKLFSSQAITLTTEGFGDWSNINAALKSHENNSEHYKSMLKWKDHELRLRKNETIDQQELALLEEERKRWRSVLTRLISIILSLASRNLAFRGSSQHLYEPDNGNFLKEVELLAKFDPVMESHLARIKDESTHTHYLGPRIQNELIQLIGDKVLQTIVSCVQDAKYYSIIFDCTPDASHKEQMSIILRSVSLDPMPEVKEYFLGYEVIEEATGLNISNVILDKLEELHIPFDDCRGQAYDHGANMKAKRQGVQARLLSKNPRALFVPCGAHAMSLVIADSAKSAIDALGYFGYVQKLFSFFSGSTQRWSILTKHVDMTLKSWSDVRWESRLQSVAAVRHQAKEIRDALLEARRAVSDPAAKVEAQTLAEEVASYRFLICSVVWFEVLTSINQVNKVLQSSSMQIDVAVKLIEKAKTSLCEYRQNGFTDAQSTAKELCEVLNAEPELKEKRLRSTKGLFAYEAADEHMNDALKKLEVTFFNTVVDSALGSLQDSFETLTEVKENFGVLLDIRRLQGMSKDALKEHCTKVEKTLTAAGESDIDGAEMAKEIMTFPELPAQTTALEMLSFLCEKQWQELCPNLWTALRIAVTLPVTVASAERSFSKRKLIKTFHRSSMAQDGLSGLAIISVNSELAQQLSYDELIDDFVSRKCRPVAF